jgi:uncharacterized protein YndB with AHSA1/START domain
MGQSLVLLGLSACRLVKNDFQPVGHSFEPHERLSYSWNASGEEGGGWPEDRRQLDADADERRHASAHGAVGLPARDEADYQRARYGWQRFVGGLERVAAGLD